MGTYKANKGPIASPATDSVVKELRRKTGDSLPVNHNMKVNLPTPGGSRQITGPATDSIVKPHKSRRIS